MFLDLIRQKMAFISPFTMRKASLRTPKRSEFSVEWWSKGVKNMQSLKWLIPAVLGVIFALPAIHANAQGVGFTVTAVSPASTIPTTQVNSTSTSKPTTTASVTSTQVKSPNQPVQPFHRLTSLDKHKGWGKGLEHRRKHPPHRWKWGKHGKSDKKHPKKHDQ